MDYRSQIQEKIADFNDGLEEDTMVFTTKIRNMISIIEGYYRKYSYEIWER